MQLAPRRPLLPLLLCVLAACASDRSGDPHPGDARLLAGAWSFVIHRAGRPDLVGDVTLAPAAPADPRASETLKGGTLAGTFRLQGAAWLTAQPVDSTASGYVDADSSFVIYLRLQGGCSNCGNIGLAGRLGADSITGHWAQEFSSSPPEGSFTMRRVGGGAPR